MKNYMDEALLGGLAWPDPVLHWGKGSGAWYQSSLSLRNSEARCFLLSLPLS